MKTLSQKSKYALCALQYLAREGTQGAVLIAQMAEREQMPRKFLELILLELRNHGILTSKRGRGGGYQLAKPPDQIFLGSVIRIFEGPLAPLPCVSETAFRKCDDCHDFASCGTRLVMREVRDSIANILDKTTLADVARRSAEAQRENKTNPMYHI